MGRLPFRRAFLVMSGGLVGEPSKLRLDFCSSVDSELATALADHRVICDMPFVLLGSICIVCLWSF